MFCGTCEVNVKKALYALSGVDKVAVELRSKLVTVKFDDGKVDRAAIREVIEEQGYDVK